MRSSTFAELARGLVFEERFDSATSIALNGGTVSSGTLQYKQDYGAYLTDSQYIQYALKVQPTSTTLWSAVVDFVPAFASTDGSVHWFFNIAGTTGIYKNSDNSLRLRHGGIDIIIAASATYGAYWKELGRNVIVAAACNTGWNLYLNGVSIGSSVIGSRPGVLATSIQVSTSTAGSRFVGWIRSLKLFKHLSAAARLSASEAVDYYQNSVLNAGNKASVLLPLDIASHDVANSVTRDRTANGYNFMFGDGVTPTTFPTKLSTVGYSLDGGDYFSTSGINSIMTSATALTVNFMWKEAATPPDSSPAYFWWMPDGNNGFSIDAGTVATTSERLRITVRLGGVIAGIRTAGGYKPITYGAYRFISVVYNGSLGASSRIAVYANGAPLSTTVYTGTIPANLPNMTTTAYIGTNNAGAFVTGSLHWLSMYRFPMTQIQVAHEYRTAISAINKA